MQAGSSGITQEKAQTGASDIAQEEEQAAASGAGGALHCAPRRFHSWLSMGQLKGGSVRTDSPDAQQGSVVAWRAHIRSHLRRAGAEGAAVDKTAGKQPRQLETQLPLERHSKGFYDSIHRCWRRKLSVPAHSVRVLHDPF